MIKRSLSQQAVKPSKLREAEAAFAEIVTDASHRGFFGSAGIVLSVQDGHIQHVKVSVEKMIK